MQQKDKVKKFIALTQTGETTAINCLQLVRIKNISETFGFHAINLTQSDWKLDLASDNYFSNPDLYYRELDVKKIEQLFNKYRDTSDVLRISSDGVIKFLEDLQLPPESRLVLIIAWKFKAQTQCEFSREEFVNGFCDLGVDNLGEKSNQNF